MGLLIIFTVFTIASYIILFLNIRQFNLFCTRRGMTQNEVRFQLVNLL